VSGLAVADRRVEDDAMVVPTDTEGEFGVVGQRARADGDDEVATKRRERSVEDER